MNTPICEFVDNYQKASPLRLHMPGHKGKELLGMERLDITEIPGADSLFEANGIIAQSERNTGELFGCYSFYSTEGSSLCIRSMLHLCTLYARAHGKKPLIAAGRNAHKVLLSGAALLDLDIQWICPKEHHSYLSCPITPEEIDDYLSTTPLLPTAVYITCPDYLGNMVDIHQISEICHRYGTILIVDNAHGAYLKFLSPSVHPIDLGADLCCDSAHKTLPVLTGGAYLHISHCAPKIFEEEARRAMSLFASTSPSYLILQSLDAVNPYLYGNYPKILNEYVVAAYSYKQRLIKAGFRFVGNEPLKWTVDCKSYGYRGEVLAAALYDRGIVCEFFDPDYLVLMLTPDIGIDGLKRLTDALLSFERLLPIIDRPPTMGHYHPTLTPRQATLCQSELLPVEQCHGRVLADASVGCPPAVSILVCGERIDRQAIEAFRYYGITHCRVCIL